MAWAPWQEHIRIMFTPSWEVVCADADQLPYPWAGILKWLAAQFLFIHPFASQALYKV